MLGRRRDGMRRLQSEPQAASPATPTPQGDGALTQHRRQSRHQQENAMQSYHQPATHSFTAALLRILERTEAMLKRRIEGQDLPVIHDEDRLDTLTGVEVQDSDWGAWVEAGGDLLMGQPRR
jgi:hypothetical protein